MQKLRSSGRFSAATAAALLSILGPAHAASADYCARHQGVAPVPPGLQAEVARTFGIPLEAARNAMVRCVGAQLLACSIGANLNCGKANLKQSLPGASAWCRKNPNTEFIPMYVTGHNTIYAWRCVNGEAVAGKTLLTVDPQGFVAENWKEID